MAPKRGRGRPRKSDKLAGGVEKQEAAVSAEAAAEDVARDLEVAEREPSPKKTKVEEKRKRGRPKKKAAAASTKVVDDDVDDSGEDEETKEEEVVEDEASGDAAKVVIIEASKECNCFKTRAAKVQVGLTKAIPGIEVLINPDKPRKGCFEVRSKDGSIYMSLLGLPRPFKKLKDLDMDKAVEEIVAKVK